MNKTLFINIFWAVAFHLIRTTNTKFQVLLFTFILMNHLIEKQNFIKQD